MSASQAPLGNELPPRVVIENVAPAVDGGRFRAKRILGERVAVTADIYADGHELLTANLLYRKESVERWSEVPMKSIGNDRWRADFSVEALEGYRYTIEAWVDTFGTWLEGLAKKAAAALVEPVDLLVGADLVERSASRASAGDAESLRRIAASLRGPGDVVARTQQALDKDLGETMMRWPDRRRAARYPLELGVTVDRERARFSSWYEMFPRSCTAEPGKHATFTDCEERLKYAAGMGFDVVYLPPIHPVGYAHRKGKNNEPVAKPGDVGSPWGIGSAEGGHTAIHPDLGTLDGFRRLVRKARELGMEIALDLAFQCAPDHPWVKEHPEWFRQRPDGTVQYAENPPKKYQDIYPIEFENEHWKELWYALRDVVLYWIEQGVRIFRVDNPHTKPFAFWEWLIEDVHNRAPDVLFLAEAFTRPSLMYRLAKLGFTQSYTYFTWRNTKEELSKYLCELTQTDVREFFRPNFWPNTPDILPECLQKGGRAAFQARLVLAATMSANYGIYGPAFELCVGAPYAPGSEEYLHSEKYELKNWEIEREDSLRDLIGRLNRIRRKYPALQANDTLAFHTVDNDHLIAYSKTNAASPDLILTVVNLDYYNVRGGWVELPLESLGLPSDRPYEVHDLLTDARYTWNGARNFIELDPRVLPAHLFRMTRRAQDNPNLETSA